MKWAIYHHRNLLFHLVTKKISFPTTLLVRVAQRNGFVSKWTVIYTHFFLIFTGIVFHHKKYVNISHGVLTSQYVKVICFIFMPLHFNFSKTLVQKTFFILSQFMHLTKNQSFCLHIF